LAGIGVLPFLTALFLLPDANLSLKTFWTDY